MFLVGASLGLGGSTGVVGEKSTGCFSNMPKNDTPQAGEWRGALQGRKEERPEVGGGERLRPNCRGGFMTADEGGPPPEPWSGRHPRGSGAIADGRRA
jgi:hypothetical protein